MKEQDYIADLFRESLENHEVPVRPEIWQNVASRIQPTVPAPDASIAQQATVASKAVTGVAGWITGAAIVVTGVAGFVAYSLLKNPEPEQISPSQQTEAPIFQVTEIPASSSSSDQTLQTVETSQNNSTNNIQDNPTADGLNQSTSQLTEEQALNQSSENESDAAVQSTSSALQTTAPVSSETQNSNGQSTQNGLNPSAPSESNSPIADPAPAVKLRIHAEVTEGIAPLETEFYVAAATGTADWVFEPASASVNGLATKHRFENPGTYDVVCRYTDPNGTVSIEHVTINVKPAFLLSINANVLTPNGDGKNDDFVVSSLEGIEIELAIYDKNGKTIYRDKGIEVKWNGQFNGKDYAPAGTYFYIIFASGEKVRTDKVTILR